MRLIIVLFLTSLSLSLSAQVDGYIDASIFLRNGDSLSGRIKLNTYSTDFVFKDASTNMRRKLGPKDVSLVYTKETTPRVLSFKIVNDGSGAAPKIVEQIVAGKIALYRRLEKAGPFYNPNEFNDGLITVYRTEKGLKFTYTAPALKSGLTMSKLGKKISTFYYGTSDSDIVKKLPKKRNEIMKLFNDCPEAMVKFRDVENKDFDFIYFLNYYNVNCAGS